MQRETVVAVAREAAECVLCATERAEDLIASCPMTDFAKLRVECRLMVSESSPFGMGPFLTVSLPPLEVEDGVAGMRSSSSFLRSNSEVEEREEISYPQGAEAIQIT